MLLADIPKGSVVAVYGPPMCGKTPIMMSMLGRISTEDPEALTVFFDTEYRCDDTTPEALKDFGIDPDRFVMYSANDVEGIGRAMRDIEDMVKAGAPVKAIAIRSATSIMGSPSPVRPIGEVAMLLRTIARFSKRTGISFIMTSHVRRDLSSDRIKSYVPAGKPNAYCDYLVNAAGETGVEISKVVTSSCDGCQAGRPLDERGLHRMSDGEYPDYMYCQEKKSDG